MTRLPDVSWRDGGHRVGALVAGCYLAAALVLALTATSRIRYSADHEGTISVWAVWVPVAIALVCARLSPPHLSPVDPLRAVDHGVVVRQARWGVGAAVAFAFGLHALGTPPPDSWYVLLKVALLVALPTLVLHDAIWRQVRARRPPIGDRWARYGAAMPVAAWLALAYLGPFARPSTGDATVISLAGVLVLNVVVEEVFYRAWLQTRLERLWGRWPAIGAAALLWAAWHLAIHGTGRPAIDVATVIAHQGVLGLLLGYLWARYRRLWPVLVIHAAVNTPLELLGTLF